MIRAVVFDFDGVIANSEPLHFRAYRDVLEPHGIALSERDYYDRYLGYDDVGAFRAIAGDRGAALSDEIVRRLIDDKAVRLEQLEREASVLFPGARSAIVRLASFFPLAIASGALKAEILRVLEHEQLQSFFRVVVAAEDTPVSKPAPDPYRLAVQLLATHLQMALRPEECVAIEDSRWGLQSARTAGLRTIGITHTYAAAELGVADATIDHLDFLTREFIEG